MTTRRRVEAILALAALTALLVVWVQATGGLPGEVAVGHWSAHVAFPLPVEAVLAFLDVVATPVGALVTVPAIALVVGRRAGAGAAGFVLASSGVVVLVAILKHLIGPTDPWVDVTGTTIGNFPSGHTAYATATFGAAATYARRAGATRRLLIAFIVGMGPARVLGGQHAVSDVVGGYTVGAAWLLAAPAAMRPAELMAVRTASRRRWPLRPAPPGTAYPASR